ncbi:MAG: TOBE domain-containing protein [Thermoleophilia bacterium]|nr:TOBE domain-containing protein [Thermoleophilia bacterium]
MTTLRDGDASWSFPHEVAASLGLAVGDAATIVVRPERMELVEHHEGDRLSPGANVLAGTVAETVYLGVARKVVVDLDRGGTVHVRVERERGVTESTHGTRVLVGWEPAAGVVVRGRP